MFDVFRPKHFSASKTRETSIENLHIIETARYWFYIYIYIITLSCHT